jgi:aminoglycoside phosphotransferase (APT) family kinase protein
VDVTAEDFAFDSRILADWLDTAIFGNASKIEIERVTGGASNLTYRLRRGHETYALRCPTSVRNDNTANTLQREIRLLKALADSDVPHARLVASDSDGSILGVSFMLTRWIDGFTPKAPLPANFRSADCAPAFAWELTDALAKIGSVDFEALGLSDFGKPDGFLERQVGRWKSQLERAHSRDIDGVDDLCAALTSSRPATQRSSLIHGDYQFINVMFENSAPPRLAAVIDWETATIGDPLLDLGWMLAGWQEPGEEPTHAIYMDWRDMPLRTAVATRYAHHTGLDVTHIHYYVALALFKLAAIMEGWYFQYLNGRSKVSSHALMKEMVPRMISRAIHFVENP